MHPFFRKNKYYYAREEIAYYYNECHIMCRKYGVSFSVCYDCDDNYSYFKNMWADQDDCCNAYRQMKSFTNLYKEIKHKLT